MPCRCIMISFPYTFMSWQLALVRTIICSSDQRAKFDSLVIGLPEKKFSKIFKISLSISSYRLIPVNSPTQVVNLFALYLPRRPSLLPHTARIV